ncbi:hypothetical protein HG537_0E02200 [Torulaspora globosa]|uniref:Uncharacterized protein n=1 Tax=Torulaspora globosa TaxID=48254 RepID=A0A7H9HWM1_9SACH|nr:hypothetical protein HG537_0E02200 [Torulaspora sp. CBS 2947]
MFKNVGNGVTRARIFISKRYQSNKSSGTVRNNKRKSSGKNVSGNEAEILQRNNGKGYFVPRVPSTDYIPSKDVQTEGLFAGYRPLFLGNSPIRAETDMNALDNFFTSFASVKITSDSKTSGDVDMQEVLEELRRDNAQMNLKNSKGKNRKPIIPWDASISGLVYNDHPFKDVPKDVVSKLKPFKLVRLERIHESSKRNSPAPKMIKLKFHNLNVSDEPEMVNLLNVHNSRKYSRSANAQSRGPDMFRQSRLNYEKELKTLAFKHKFIKSDRKVFKSESDKLNRMLAKEFHRQTKLSIRNEFSECLLPLYIYVNKSLLSRRLFRSFLRKWLMEHIEPVLLTILASYDNEERAKRFHAKVKLKVENMVHEVSKHIPSVYFTGDSVDCVVRSSTVTGFKRMYWLKPTKRRTLFWGKNADKDYLFTLDGSYNITRSGVKYMRYPNNLSWSTFDEAFSEWDYHA